MWLLFFHLVGAFCFFMGGAVAGTLQVAALRERRPSTILTLLRLTRVGVVLVAAGALMTLGFGIALAEDIGYGLSPAWIKWALGLWVVSVVLGGIGGRTARHARYRAEQAVEAGDEPDEELQRLVAHRPSLWLSWISGALLVVIVVLMVWKPA